jgi:SAM-dependent methyltransferase
MPYNRALWDHYARSWSDLEFREQQLDPGSNTDVSALKVLGEEWARVSDLDVAIAEFIEPFVNPQSVAAEIGVGGGRVAVRVAPRVARLFCLDVSSQMLRRARAALANHSNTEFIRLSEPRLPRELAGQLDFVYAFDVFVHLDLHTVWTYIQEFSTALRPGGHALIHVANLTAPAGWELFARQERYSVEDFYFMSPELVHTLIDHTNLKVVKTSRSDPANLYLNRDYLVVVEKPAA